jgi:hypothetical protein
MIAKRPQGIEDMGPMTRTFDNILLLGRPAAGKSEFIDFMKRVSGRDRAELYRIGRFEEVDDFPWLWEKFLEDNLWEEAGFPRLYSHREGGNIGLNRKSIALFDLMIVRFNHEVEKRYMSRPEFYDEGTLFIEFSRGADGGYRRALGKLSVEILRRSAILYVDVSFDESWRRNIARYEERKKHSILAHMATRRVMETIYSEDDWAELSCGKADGSLDIGGARVPFVVVHNEPEVKEDKLLAERYGPRLRRLMELYESKA